MTKTVLAVSCAVAACGLAMPASGQFLALDLSPTYNATNLQFNNGITFPVGEQTYGGIPFQFAGSAAPGTPIAWAGSAAGGTNPRTLNIAVNTFGVDRVHTILNTVWGSTTAGLISITFIASGGLEQTFNLTGGTDVRDYNNDAYTNTFSASTTFAAFNNGQGQRLDRQVFDLSPAFQSATLLTIRVIDNGSTGVSRAVLSAATLEANPIPAPAGAGVLTAAGILLLRRRQR